MAEVKLVVVARLAYCVMMEGRATGVRQAAVIVEAKLVAVS